MKAKMSVAFLALVAMLAACDKNKNSGNTVQKNPPQIEVLPESQRVREKIATLDTSSLAPELNNLDENGFSSELNCFQLVEIKNGTQSLGQFLEVSGKACPTEGLIAESDILVRLTVKTHPKYFTQYRFYLVDSANSEKEVGMSIRYSNKDINGVETITFKLHGLCNAANSGWITAEEDADVWNANCEVGLSDGSLIDIFQ